MDTATKLRHQREHAEQLANARDTLRNGVVPNVAKALDLFAALQASYQAGGRWHPDSATDDGERALFAEFVADAVGNGEPGILALMDAPITLPAPAMTAPQLLAFAVEALYGLDAASGGMLALPVRAADDGIEEPLPPTPMEP